jgi:ferric-dicitrate binding protein FerR (iron transport regulator)
VEIDAREQPDPRVGQLKDAGPIPAVEERIVRGALARLDAPAPRPWLWFAPPAVVGAGLAAWALVPTVPPVTPSAAPGPYTTTADVRVLTVGPHRLELRADSSAELVRAASDAVQVDLQRGTLDCDVEPLAPGGSFEVRTEQATVRVIGTRFEVTATGPCTRVSVEEGRVRVDAETADAPLFIDAGASREVCDAPPPVAATPPAPPSQADMMRTGLDQMAGGDVAAAIVTFGAYRAAYPDGMFLEDALFHEAVLELRRDRRDAARALINRLSERFPESSQRKTLEDMLQR